MDAIREKLNTPLFAGIAGAVLGLILGLIFAWGIWPVEYKDAAPMHLHPGFQEDYMVMAVDAFKVDQNTPLAVRRYQDLGENAAAVLEKVIQEGRVKTEDATSFQKAIEAPAVAPTAEATETTEAGGAKTRSPLVTILIVMCGLTLLLGVAFAVFYFLRSRGSGTSTPALQAQEAARQAQWTDYEAIGETAPISQFMASYKLGDDLFDDSFSIDSPSGEFLGECGVGISETIGVGDPKKATAFEVWLFDKNDIQTITKVLMSTHSFQEDSIRQRLAAKGEPVEIQPGSQTELETATLRLSARVVDMAYGEGALPDQSFFDTLILEIAVWQK
jgi:hypothetical protein